MSNNTGLTPFNGHRIQGRSSESFIDAREVISRLNLGGNEVFMDAGCGDGHTALIAQDIMNDEAIIYALDVYEPSIEDLEKDIKEKGINNLIPIQSDITGDIKLSNDTVDVTLMINVFHGFVARNNVDEAICELKRITKPGGKIAIMDYKKMETKYGPPFQVRSSPEELEEMFEKHGLKKFKLDNDIGEDLDGGLKSHYLVEFRK
ncbi:MAG: SAM-dependent methyltransferase [Methanobacteriales archaeon HGW-Methanobacteriales-1]|nr:MAG: SAM-dependent methyltransferase [Methanobacteriales archaeon HGW-Methanobacteriales-1]